MKRLIFALAFFAGSLVFVSHMSAEEKKPKRPKRPAPVVSPILGENGSVTFQISAPDAEQVSVSGQMIDGKLELEKGEKGIWSGTLESVEPGIYEYSITVDGIKMVDPGNPELKPMRSPRTSVLHIPGDHSYDFKDVPHGTVHYHAYQSKSIGRFRELQVYTPPGYETGKETYPLLVLQHGHGDSFATWVAHGKANWILDNLIAEGKAVPMIVAMLDGHPIPGSYGDGRSTENTEELRKDLMQTVLPMLEKTYRLKEGRDNRAIAGLSMGGLHSLTIGLSELDTFSWIGAFSAAAPDPKVLKDVFEQAGTNDRINLLWIACGKEDFLLEENEDFTKLLDKNEIDYEWRLTEGGHSWPVWRDYLTEFAPLLFQAK